MSTALIPYRSPDRWIASGSSQVNAGACADFVATLPKGAATEAASLAHTDVTSEGTKPQAAQGRAGRGETGRCEHPETGGRCGHCPGCAEDRMADAEAREER